MTTTLSPLQSTSPPSDSLRRHSAATLITHQPPAISIMERYTNDAPSPPASAVAPFAAPPRRPPPPPPIAFIVAAVTVNETTPRPAEWDDAVAIASPSAMARLEIAHLHGSAAPAAETSKPQSSPYAGDDGRNHSAASSDARGSKNFKLRKVWVSFEKGDKIYSGTTKEMFYVCTRNNKVISGRVDIMSSHLHTKSSTHPRSSAWKQGVAGGERSATSPSLASTEC